MTTPLYMPVKAAAEYAGIGRDTLDRFLNSDDPPPYLKIGNRRLLQIKHLGDYLEKQQIVKWTEETR